MDTATEVQRFLLEMERQRKLINHEILDPEIQELTLEAVTPILTMVAKARSHYLQTYMTVAKEHTEPNLTAEEVKTLRAARISYDELVHASQALETAISRGYLTIKSTG